MIPERISEFAKEQGFELVEYIGEGKGFKCYEPVFRKGKVAFTGLPLFIMEDKSGNIRMSTPEEALQQIDECEF